LVGLRCNAGVVRQRLVVANHQASGASQSRHRVARVASPPAGGSVRRGEHLDSAPEQTVADGSTISAGDAS